MYNFSFQEYPTQNVEGFPAFHLTMQFPSSWRMSLGKFWKPIHDAGSGQ
jgi:hypothetical protein